MPLKLDIEPSTEGQLYNGSNDSASKGRRWAFRTTERRVLLLVTDIVLVNAAVVMGLWMWTLRAEKTFSVEFVIDQAYWFPLLSAIWLLTATLSNLYDLGVAAYQRRTARALTQVAGLLMVTYLLVYFLSPPSSLPRLFVLYFVVVSCTAIGIWRYIYTTYLGRNLFKRRAVIIGSNENTADVVEVIQKYAGPHYVVVGSLNGGEDTKSRGVDSLPTLGTTAELAEVVQSLAVSEVIIATFDNLDGTLIRGLIDCQEQGIQITPMSSIYEELTSRIPLALVAEGWLDLLPLQHASTGVIFPLVKRLLDIALAVIGLSGLLVILPFVAIAIRLDSPGSIFYSQDRVGKGGRIFRTYKFRSMRIDAEMDKKAVWAQQHDPRVTRMGRILRATHLDEFPQVFNVLRGDTSAVGPRPERPELAAELEKAMSFYRVRHSVRPGMAGWALIKQGYSGSVDAARLKLEYDFYYIKHQSIWLDLVILLKTFVDAATLRGR